MKEVFIYKFEDGIFSSEMTFTDGERTIAIDSRTSDAIAIAMRAKAPIYTTRAIMEETGFVMEVQEGTPDTEQAEGSTHEEDNAPRMENFTVEELERTLARLIEREQYEEAARVS